MDLYFDTADIGQIEEAARCGVLRGITTNPILLARAGHDDAEIALEKTCSIVPGPVSMECATEAEGMVQADWQKLQEALGTR